MDNLLVAASWSEELKSLLGLYHVSHKWGNIPEWYFWITGAEGVFGLRLEDAWSENIGKPNYLSGLFSIRIYPFIESPIFVHFSSIEQEYIRSEKMDSTNTPFFEESDSIPEPLFLLGTLEWRSYPRDNWDALSLEALSIQNTFQKHMKVTTNSNVKIRSLPAWDLAYPLFDRIISLLAYYEKNKPSRVMMTRSQGFGFEIDGDSRSTSIFCNDSELLWGKILLGSNCASSSHQFGNTYSESGIEIIFDRMVTGNCVHTSFDPKFPFNSLWWSLPEGCVSSQLCSICGCSHE